MAEFDSSAAFVAACHALTEVGAHDREYYPSILLKIDRDRGTDWLIRHFPRETSQLVRVSIGRSLECNVPSATISDMMRDEDERTRAAAAELIGWADLDNSFDVVLAAALDDRSDKVIRATIAAQKQRRDRHIVDRLLFLMSDASDPTKKEIGFDALIEFLDPGGVHDAITEPLQRALDAVSPFRATRAIERLEKRRKELFDRLKKE